MTVKQFLRKYQLFMKTMPVLLRAKMEVWFNCLWYTDDLLIWRKLLSPCAYVYQNIVAVRRAVLERFLQQHVNVPIVVVGNLNVGGVGKTPLVIALANKLQAQGWRVGIVSRGFGATIRTFPHLLSTSDTAIEVGDEPLLMMKRTSCPVVIAPNRMDAVQLLLKQPHPPQVILSDDGLQHYKMGRSVEIAVVDAQRQLGNQYCLPAGPLREPAKRLNEVDLIVVNGAADFSLLQTINKPIYQMSIQADDPHRIDSNEKISWDTIEKPVAAVAGIGHPERFFKTLQNLHIEYQAYIFPDHHSFQSRDFEKFSKTVVMTEKDAVKCAAFATDSMYYLPIEAHLSDDFWDTLKRFLSAAN